MRDESTSGRGNVADAWERARRCLGEGRQGHLTVIQNLRSSGGYIAIGFSEDAQRAWFTLKNSGQRYPGFVVHVVHANEAEPHPPAPEPRVLDGFTLRLGSTLVLAWMPEASVPSRCGVHWVGPTTEAIGSARRMLRKLKVAALAGIVTAIDCSEDGPFAGYAQERRNAIGLGIR